MGVNKTLLAIILIVVAGALWVSLRTGQKIYHYASLQARVPAENLVWDSVARDNEHYLPQAHYTYHVDDRLYDGMTILSAPAARNRWAAKQLLPEMQSTHWYVWYYPSDPSIASLERTFPLKETLYSGMIWGIVVYFIFLNTYIRRR